MSYLLLLAIALPLAAAAAEPIPAPAGPDGAPMVLVPAGEFLRGSRTGEAIERPALTLTLDAFALDRTEVTVARFRAFVEATGHRTVAEREGWAWVWVGEWGKSGKFVRTAAADWQHPKGPGSDSLPKHSVTQVAYPDTRPTVAGPGSGSRSRRNGRRQRGGRTGGATRGATPSTRAVQTPSARLTGFPRWRRSGPSRPAPAPPAPSTWRATSLSGRPTGTARTTTRPAPPAIRRAPRRARPGSPRAAPGAAPPDWSTVTNRYDRVPDYRNTKIGFRCAKDAP